MFKRKRIVVCFALLVESFTITADHGLNTRNDFVENHRPSRLVDHPTDVTPVNSEKEKDLSNFSFNDVTWVSAHNAHANNFAAGDDIVKQMATNQEYSVYKQLKEVGVRGLMLDVQYVDNDVRLVHGIVEYNSLIDIINEEISPFLDEDKDAIITIDFETLGDRELLKLELKDILQQATTFTKRIFKINDPKWDNKTEWPTIQEMRDTDQRVILLTDSIIVESEDYGMMLRKDIVMENMWGTLEGCTSRWARPSSTTSENKAWASSQISGYGEERNWTRLFTMNHFCCTTGLESLNRVKTGNIGGGDNGWGIIFPRAMMCMAANGHTKKPNFLAVDWAHIGDAQEVAYYFNFGGRLGTGQRCHSGLDCATGACSATRHCHCLICSSTERPNGCNSGCDVEEKCIESKDNSVNKCMSQKTTVEDEKEQSHGAAPSTSHTIFLVVCNLIVISFIPHNLL